MRRILFISSALCLGLTGCGPAYEPLTREGVWRAEHTNRANLTLMAASPADLVRGTGTTATDGQVEAAAVERYRNDKVKKLPDSGLTQLSVNGSGGNNAGGGQ
jgi:type IV pilus biogenesis protein CpaD/CtpE